MECRSTGQKKPRSRKTAGAFCYRPAVETRWPVQARQRAALVSYLRKACVDRAVTLDWAIANPLVIRSADTMPVLDDSYSLLARHSIKDDLLACGRDQACVLISHPDGRQLFPGVNETARAELSELHLKMEPEQIIPDSHGSPALEIFRPEIAR